MLLRAGWYPARGDGLQRCRYQPSGERTLSKFCASGNRKGFLSNWLGNIKQELAEKKEMNESIKKKKKF